MKNEKILLALLAIKTGKSIQNSESIYSIKEELIQKGLMIDSERPSGYKLTERGEYLINLLNSAYDFFETEKEIKEEAGKMFEKFKKGYNSLIDSLKFE